MPLFNRSSLSRLSTCHHELQILFHEVIKYYDCSILEGYRDKIHQERAFKAGATKLHYPAGKHNQIPSLAVDAAPYPVDWKKPNNFLYFAGFVMGIAAKLKQDGIMKYEIKFGGDWNMNHDITDESFKDWLHFEIKGAT